MSRPQVLIALALLAVLAGIALYDASRSGAEVELAVVQLEVDAIRKAMLSQEQALHALPQACGSEAKARASVGPNTAENLGECGLALFGREPKVDGPYYVTVAPGAVDFTVVGFGMQDGQVVEFRANRSLRAAKVENKEKR